MKKKNLILFIACFILLSLIMIITLSKFSAAKKELSAVAPKPMFTAVELRGPTGQPDTTISLSIHSLNSNTPIVNFSASKNIQQQYIIKSPPGCIYKIRFNDSTIIFLNAASEIIFDKTTDSITIISLNGECLLIPHSIISIHLPEIKCTCKGKTAMHAYLAEPLKYISAISGLLQFQHGQHNISLSTPGQTFYWDSKKDSTALNDPDECTAWAQGYLFFTGKSKSEILNMLERWYDKKFILKGPNINIIAEIPDTTDLITLLQSFKTGKIYTSFEVKKDSVIITKD